MHAESESSRSFFFISIVTNAETWGLLPDDASLLVECVIVGAEFG